MAQPEYDFSEQLYHFLGEIKEIKKSPSKGRDLATLSKIAATITSLEKVAKSLLSASNETLRYDAKLVTNMLETPISPSQEPETSVSPLDAAHQFLKHKEHGSNLEKIVGSCLETEDRMDQIMEDLSDILMDLKELPPQP